MAWSFSTPAAQTEVQDLADALRCVPAAPEKAASSTANGPAPASTASHGSNWGVLRGQSVVVMTAQGQGDQKPPGRYERVAGPTLVLLQPDLYVTGVSEARRYPYREESADFVERAPVRFTVEREIPVTPQRLFEIFEDAEAWTKWAGLAFVNWTSPKPYGPGTTRTVGLGPIEVDEKFIEFVPGERGCPSSSSPEPPR